VRIAQLRTLAFVLVAAVAAIGVSPASSADEPTPAELRLATFNLLGATHTDSGSLEWMGTGEERMHRAVKILDNNHVSVVGFQEMQARQVSEFMTLRGTTWGLYPGSQLRDRDGANSIAWRRNTWKLIEKSTRPIPYFDGREREMPVLLLQHKESGQLAYFFNLHAPVSNKKHGDQDYWRKQAINLSIDVVNELRAASTLPVFVTGDFNEREKVFCPFGRRADLIAANGGSVTDTTCTMPPKPLLVDWIFGTSDVSFHDYVAKRTPLVEHTTDHPVVVSSATLPPP